MRVKVFYIDIDTEGITVEAKKELKEMLKVQSQYFGSGRNYNEFAINAKGMNNVESERGKFLASSGDDADASALDYDGNNNDGECAALIKRHWC